MNFSEFLARECIQALTQAYPEFYSQFNPHLIEITEATNEKFGHYQCNSAMKLAKLLGEKPRTIAEKIVEKLNEIQSTPPLFSTLEIAGPGFINFTFSPSFLNQCINAQLHDPRLGLPLPEKQLKVVIDLSAPNTAKEMHVGHLRSTIIGDCLARVYRFIGHSVLPLNHVGDWGTQFGMLIAHIKTIMPSIMDAQIPDIALGELAQWYKDSKQRFDEDPAFKKQAQLEVVELQAGNVHSKRAWEHICAISRIAYQHIYDLLEVDLQERGESFYNPFLSDLVKTLENKGMVTVSEGAKCIYLDGFTNREGEPLPLILQKADGGFNYSTTDLAALKHRVEKDGGEILLYVVDIGQSLHFQMLFEAAQKANFYSPDQVTVAHVPFGFVLRSDGKKFKTRSGETERLIDLMNTAIAKAKDALLQRNPEMSEQELTESAKALGINAIKYADLSCHRTSDYVFSYDKMLRFEGNTAAFLLYAYVRIQSIERKTKIKISDLLTQNEKIKLEHSEEIALGLLVCQFSEVITALLHDFSPNRLTDYLYRLAERFHSFFHHCRVEGSPQQNSRLLLCEAVAQVLRRGFDLLGLKPIDRM